MVYPVKSFESKNSTIYNTKTSNFKAKTKSKRGKGKSFYREFSRNSTKSTSYVNTYTLRKSSHNQKVHQFHFRKRRPPSRAPSPVLGSEEYMKRKIEQTSSIIMKQLLNPEVQTIEKKISMDVNNKTEVSLLAEKNDVTASNRSKTKKVPVYDIEEIHNKIMSHITNLNDYKKKNFINAETTGYDLAIQQIQKQKRLEISRALRHMCSKESNCANDIIMSIIPDIGIKIEELPLEVIEELRNTLDLEQPGFDDNNITYLNDIDPNLQFENQLQDKLNEETGVVHIKTEPVYSENAGTSISSNQTHHEETNFNKNFPHTSKIESKGPHIQFENNQLRDNNMLNDEASVVDIKTEPVDSEHIDIFTSSSQIQYDATNSNNNIQQTSQTEFKNGNEMNPLVFNINVFTPEKLNNQFENNSEKMCNEKEVQTEFARNSSEKQIQTNVSASSLLNIILDDLKECKPENLQECVNIMLKVDNIISNLTQLRQNIFKQFNSTQSKRNKDNRVLKKRKKQQIKVVQKMENVVGCNSNKLIDTICTEENIIAPNCIEHNKLVYEDNSNLSTKKRKKGQINKRASKNTTISKDLIEIDVQKIQDKNMNEKSKSNKIMDVSSCNYNFLEFKDIVEKVLVIKIFDNKVIIATESGKIYHFSLNDGSLIQKLDVTNVPITSLCFWKHAERIQMCCGSFETILKIYEYETYSLLHQEDIDDSVQCMELCWDYIFLGCIRGTLIRYSIKKQKVEFQDQIGSNSILVLKATQEGARRVLLVGTRNASVSVRDAMTGLYMRALDNTIQPTVYSLLVDKSLVYCGTTMHNILVFSFHDGELVHTHKATNARGIGCLKLYENLLFASCHNGYIYVYNTLNNKYIDSIQGPGGVILSLEVINNQVIVGTMSFQFKSIPISKYILQHINQSTDTIPLSN